MDEHTYFISEVSKLVGVEPHVLRYWEEELEMEIPRNSQGKRCYGEQDVELMKKVKYWKDKGMQLRAVKEMLTQEEVLTQKEEPFPTGKEHKDYMSEYEKRTYMNDNEWDPLDPENSLVVVDASRDPIQMFEKILDDVVERALERNNDYLLERIEEMMKEGAREAAAAQAGGKKVRGKFWKRIFGKNAL